MEQADIAFREDSNPARVTAEAPVGWGRHVRQAGEERADVLRVDLQEGGSLQDCVVALDHSAARVILGSPGGTFLRYLFGEARARRLSMASLKLA